MQIGRDFSDASFETERLQKRVDGLSFRLTLALLLIFGAIAALSFVGYSRLNALGSAMQRPEDPIPANHPVHQQLFALSARTEELSHQLGLHKASMEQIRKALDKAHGEGRGNLDSISQSLQDLEKRLALLEAPKGPDPKILTTLSEGLAQVRANLGSAGEEQKKLAAELAASKRENAQLKQLQESQKTLVDSLQKDLQAMTLSRQNDLKTLQQIRTEHQNLQKEMEKLPRDAVRRVDLDTLARRNEGERAALENRINQKFQQIQVSLDAAIRAGMPPVETSGQRSAPIVQQELLQE